MSWGSFGTGRAFFFCSVNAAITSQETNKRLRNAARAATNARRQLMQKVMLRCASCPLILSAALSLLDKSLSKDKAVTPVVEEGTPSQ
jgi:hypothetical protein